MPFRNFTLRLFTRMLQIEDNVIASVRLTELQQGNLKAIFLSSVQALKKLMHRMYEEITYVERWLPELRLYENLVAEIGNFVPPEECLKAEFHRLLSHPAIILRVIPENAFDKGPRSLPLLLQFPSNQMPSIQGSSQTSLKAFLQNTIRNFLLYRHLVSSHLVGEKPLTSDYQSLISLEEGRSDRWRVGELI